MNEEMTAFHEAGHAVIGYKLGLPISRITIIREVTEDYDREGGTYHSDVLEPGNLEHERISSIFCLAGSIACLTQFPGKEQITAFADSIDWNAGAGFLMRGGKSYSEAFTTLENFEPEAADLVSHQSNWKAICDVAKVLMVEKEIDGMRLRDIIDRVKD